jgi:hypothetical protein
MRQPPEPSRIPTSASESRRARERIPVGDDDFDSFNEALHTAPWVVGLAFLVAARFCSRPFPAGRHHLVQAAQDRLQNEAMLQLAEEAR